MEGEYISDGGRNRGRGSEREGGRVGKWRGREGRKMEREGG